MNVTCPACNHSDEYPGDASQEIIRCEQCKARIAYGVLMPRIVNQPHDDRRFVTMRVETVSGGQPLSITLTFDKAFAAAVARDLGSIAR